MKGEDSWKLAMASFPCGVVAFWAVGSGFYSLAVLATAFGGFCLFLAAQ